MKKVLLTTTALAMTAGVASAEITFSGVGEAGFYRTGKSGAVAAAPGKQHTYAISSTKLTKTTVTTAATTTTIAAKLVLLNVEKGDLARAQAALAETTDGSVTNMEDLVTAVATAEKDLAIAQAVYDAHLGTAAAAAVKAGDMQAYSGYDFNVAASAAADNGMTFAFGFDMGAGHIADQDDDRAMDAQAGTIAADEVTIGYNGYTIKIGDDLIDDLYDDVHNGDVSLAGSFGDLTFNVVTDLDKDVAANAGTFTAASGTTPATWTAASAAEWNPTSYAVGYSMGDMSFAMSGTDHDQFGNAAAKYELTYKVLPALSATLSSDNLGTYKDVGKLSATYTLSDAMSITASVKDDKDHALNTNTGGKQSQDMSIAYSAGALSATVASDESSNWWVNAKYDLGGGAQAFTTFDHTEFLVAGVNFAF
jgi:outer membrane protein OmpU